MRDPNPGPAGRVRPGPGQESVWDYPRPPRLEPSAETVAIVLGGVVVARSSRALRVLETSHPPTYYVPAGDFAAGALRAAAGESWCEWKGRAAYLDVVGGASPSGPRGRTRAPSRRTRS